MLEKLTELLSDFFHIGGDCCTYNLERHKSAFEIGTITTDDFREWNSDDVAELAAHLIANGVTIQRWIPVTERKPTAADADAKGKVFAYSKEGTANAHGWWFVATSPTIFTHWMPPPQAPGKDGA